MNTTAGMAFFATGVKILAMAAGLHSLLACAVPESKASVVIERKR